MKIKQIPKTKSRKKDMMIKVFIIVILLAGVIGLTNTFAASTAVSTSTTTAIPSGYHFAPRFISGTTTVTRSTAPTGYQWVLSSGGGYYQLQTTAGKATMPGSSYKGKIYVYYKNVGTYFDDEIDMKITITDWNSACKRIEFGQTYLGFGNVSGDDGGTDGYMDVKIEYFYSGTTTLVSNFKGHQPVGDMDYWSDTNQCEWIKTLTNTGKFIFDEGSYSNFNLSKVSSNMVGVKKGYGGTSNGDGLSFAYLITSATHTVRWYGGFLRMNLTCPIKEFEVWYMPNGGDGDPYSKVYKYGVSTTWLANKFTKTGYHAKGGDSAALWHVYRDYDDKWAGYDTDAFWQTAQPTSDSSYRHYQSGASVSTTAPCGNIYAYVCWEANTYTIKYDGNGATSGTVADQSATYDTSLNLQTNGYSRTGYTFKEWNTKADGTGNSYTPGQSVKNLTATNGGVVQLYAIWNISSYSNTINHYMTGMSSNYKIATTTFTNNYGVNFNLSGRDTTVPNGYYADTEYTSSSITGTSASYSKSTTITQIDGSMTFNFYYHPYTYNIKYNLNGGTNSSSNPSTYTVLNGVSLANPTKAGYTFDGWYLDDGTKITGINEGCTASFSSVSDMYSQLSSRTTGDITVTAKFSPVTYTVVYYGNGNTGGSTSPTTHTSDVPANLATNGYTKTNYYFKEWNTKADGTGTSYGEGEEVVNLMSTSGTFNLYAIWITSVQEKTFTIKYNANGGSGSMANTTFVESEAKYLSTCTFTRDGYRFVEWNTKPDGTGSIYEENEIVEFEGETDGQVLTLYAQWQKYELLVYYDANGGTVSNSGFQIINDVIHYVGEQISSLASWLSDLF